MKYSSLLPFIGALFAVSNFPCHAQNSINDCILELDFAQHGSGRYSQVLMRPDNTFQEVLNADLNPDPANLGSYAPTESGTYEIVPDSGNSDRFTLSFATATRSWNVVVRFTGVRGGSIEQAPWGGLAPYFTVYPRVSTDELRNISTRAWVSNDRPAIGGFIIDGDRRRWVLIRGVGPSLRKLGVTNAIDLPVVRLFRRSGSTEVEYAWIAKWSDEPNLVAGFSAVFDVAGAFSFESGSTDCAALMLLGPGEYTVVCSSESGEGEMLVEVYLLPYTEDY